MDKKAPKELDIQELFKQHRAYVEDLQRRWLVGKRSTSKDVFEVMRPKEREQVYQTIRNWEVYITPIAEAWWRERGYGVIWPEKNSDPMRVYKLEEPANA